MKSHVEERYGIEVHFVAIPPPFIGDLNGAEIRIAPELDLELAVFNLAHLFGHTVQWNTDPESINVGADLVPGKVSPEDLLEVNDYESEASRYALQLLHEVGAQDLDGWFCDFAASDNDYLVHFYTTGEKRDFTEFWKTGRPPLAPLAVPPFTPTQAKFRWEGVVV
jgi:hypothetical protein